ncbi:hypothetical protein DIURU_001455 [Diutina rugosa]|uniref:Non-structural maintenance of chromosomes element 1 homolog n=1 Tax=Diutina rugosa TaxID=5481 RepID=A0A642UUP3_DIURU|nr:uncharacterized protein DIURU_001455 [Diutina rugosa]KAA8905652.1 hypothetical protein DIURU_001455 [Diutina rugosa]
MSLETPSPPPEVTYTDTHRAFFAYLRSVQSLSQSQAKRVLAHLDSSSSLDVDDVVTEINSRIGEHGFKIERKIDEVTAELNYIFINFVNDAIARQATSFTPAELECIKHLIDDIVEADNSRFSIGLNNARRKAKDEMALTLEDADFFIRRLVDTGWLEIHNDQVYMSQRALAELKGWLADRYVDSGLLLSCKQCHDWVTVGYLTDDGAFHKTCFVPYQRQHPGIDSKKIGRPDAFAPTETE